MTVQWMTIAHDIATWRLLPVLAFAVCYPIGLAFFGSLRWVANGLIAGRMSAAALQLARFVALGLVLWGLVLLGPLCLIAGTAGALVAQRRVIAKLGIEG
jgi:hypothetical protein